MQAHELGEYRGSKIARGTDHADRNHAMVDPAHFIDGFGELQ